MSPAASSRAPAFSRVLLAEDDPTQGLVLEHQLKKAGYAVEMASDGKAALARLIEGNIPILITDLDMPEMDGVTLCRRVRESCLTQYVYILMLTHRTDCADVVKGLEAGADDFVRKPVNQIELIARVKNGERVARLHWDAHRLSITDPLLDVFNRRYLSDELPREVARAHRYRRPLSLISCDLDNFKLVNDQRGHAAGDQVLVAFARTARGALRSSDWLARVGGEEFVCVLPETSLDEAKRVAERIREEVASTVVATPTGSVTVTASFGVAELTAGCDEGCDSLLRKADRALYWSKDHGRNRITEAGELLSQIA